MNCKLASIALVAFILAGCGNDDKGDSTDAGTGSPPEAANKVCFTCF